jgi:ubiquinone/menaquinone biosynthesis C-methylase UbiE
MDFKTIRVPAAGSAAGEGAMPVGRQAFSEPRSNVAKMGLSEGLVVADFGAGSGHYSIAAARAVGHSGRVYAIDIQKELLTRIKNLAAAERVRNVQVLWGDIDEPGGSKLREGSADVVLLSNTLFQVEHKDALLTEAKRVLRPKGRLIVIDWTDSFGGLGPAPKDVVTEREAHAMLTKAGFSIEKSFDAGAHHFGVIGRKTG